jgi:hypothetical protein
LSGLGSGVVGGELRPAVVVAAVGDQFVVCARDEVLGCLVG